MIRGGSLVKFVGKKTFPEGKMLMVHEVKEDSAIVWIDKGNGKWGKKTVPLKDLEEVVE